MAQSELIFTPRRTAGGRSDRWPVWKTIGYTLNISVRFLASYAVGRGSVARCDELLDWYWRHILDSGNASLRASGRENFTRGVAHVVMSNHSSLLDIPALMGAVPGSVRMVTKEELTRIPLWGQALITSGFIPISRGNREKAIAQLERAKATLLQGVNVWISPEGTRSRTGELGTFKKGGFHTAIDLGVPIIPAWIHGASKIIPPDQFIAHYGGTVEVRFGRPIQTAGVAKEEMETLMERVRVAILELSKGPLPDVERSTGAENAPTA